MRANRIDYTRSYITLYILLGLLLLGVLILLILGIISAVNIYNINTNINNEHCCNCFDEGRSQAYAIGDGITRALNLLSINPFASADLFISYFADNSTWSTSEGNFFGADNIKAFYLSYALFPGETNQTIVIHKRYWDPKKSTLSLERNWTAVLTQSRIFTNYSTFVPNATLPINSTYTQDDFVIIRFQCDSNGNYEIVYYREYVDSVQSQTFFTTDYPPVCLPCDND